MTELIKNLQKVLAPPGMGVHTVHTAKEIKDKYFLKLYKTCESSVVESQWHKSLQEMSKTSLPFLIGIPSDTGGGIQRGANWGPLFIRDYTHNLKETVLDIGDIKTIPHLLHDKYLNEETLNHLKEFHYQGEDYPASPLSIAEYAYQNIYKEIPEAKMIALGGDHSISYPIVKQWILHRRSLGKKVAIIHFDAHTDLMDERLGIDICFASWAYHMIDLLEKPSDLIQFGIRSSGQDKKFWESKLGIKQYWNYDFKNLGLDQMLKETKEYLSKNKIDEIYVSFDIDFLDAKYASSTGTPEDEGLAPHEGTIIIEELAKDFKLTGADLVEVAPFVTSYKKSDLSPEPETTLLSASVILNKIIESMHGS
jgi:agmatinase